MALWPRCEDTCGRRVALSNAPALKVCFRSGLRHRGPCAQWRKMEHLARGRPSVWRRRATRVDVASDSNSVSSCLSLRGAMRFKVLALAIRVRSESEFAQGSAFQGLSPAAQARTRRAQEERQLLLPAHATCSDIGSSSSSRSLLSQRGQEATSVAHFCASDEKARMLLRIVLFCIEA